MTHHDCFVSEYVSQRSERRLAEGLSRHRAHVLVLAAEVADEHAVRVATDEGVLRVERLLARHAVARKTATMRAN